MSSNVETVKNMYAAFHRGDIAAILAHLTDDVQWGLGTPNAVPFSGNRHGHAGVTEFFQAIGGSENNCQVDIKEFLDAGDNVVTIGRYSAGVTATGKSFATSLVHVFTFRDGKVCRFIDQVDMVPMVAAHTA